MPDVTPSALRALAHRVMPPSPTGGNGRAWRKYDQIATPADALHAAADTIERLTARVAALEGQVARVEAVAEEYFEVGWKMVGAAIRSALAGKEAR